jgi:hypothetical protein
VRCGAWDFERLTPETIGERMAVTVTDFHVTDLQRQTFIDEEGPARETV